MENNELYALRAGVGRLDVQAFRNLTMATKCTINLLQTNDLQTLDEQ
jgi:hypothetical protein